MSAETIESLRAEVERLRRVVRGNLHRGGAPDWQARAETAEAEVADLKTQLISLHARGMR